MSESNVDRDNSSNCDFENVGDDIYDSNLSEDRLYLDGAYIGKIYDESDKGKITLERGILFAIVDAFREVLRDYVVQEGFKIVRIRNERARITAMCIGRDVNSIYMLELTCIEVTSR